MDSKIIVESFLNATDIGTVFEPVNNYRKRSWKVDLGEIIKYMIIGKGYTNPTPPQTSRLLFEKEDNFLIVDLLEIENYEKNHINESISRPIYSPSPEYPASLMERSGNPVSTWLQG